MAGNFEKEIKQIFAKAKIPDNIFEIIKIAQHLHQLVYGLVVDTATNNDFTRISQHARNNLMKTIKSEFKFMEDVEEFSCVTNNGIEKHINILDKIFYLNNNNNNNSSPSILSLSPDSFFFFEIDFNKIKSLQKKQNKLLNDIDLCKAELKSEEKEMRNKKTICSIFGIVYALIFVGLISRGIESGGIIVAAFVSAVGVVGITMALFASLSIAASVTGQKVYSDIEKSVSRIGGALETVIENKNEMTNLNTEMKIFAKLVDQPEIELMDFLKASDTFTTIQSSMENNKKILEALGNLLEQVRVSRLHHNRKLKPLIADLQLSPKNNNVYK